MVIHPYRLTWLERANQSTPAPGEIGTFLRHKAELVIEVDGFIACIADSHRCVVYPEFNNQGWVGFDSYRHVGVWRVIAFNGSHRLRVAFGLVVRVDEDVTQDVI